MRSDRAPASRRVWAALIFLTLGTVTGVWHNRRVNSGQPDYLAGSVRAVVSVPARAFRGGSGWFGRQTEWIRRGRALAGENRALRDRVTELEGENNQLKEAQIDLDRVRADLGFAAKAKHKLIPADIIGMKSDIIAMKPDPKFDSMVISHDSDDGMKSNSVVVSRDGVVGRIYEMVPKSASVLMLTDQRSGVGARLQRCRAVAICEGDNSPTLSMIGLPNTADVRVGDIVETSGYGGVYPAGLLIGAVSEVRRDAANGGMVVRVTPQVAFDRLEEVYVIP